MGKKRDGELGMVPQDEAFGRLIGQLVGMPNFSKVAYSGYR